jgi:MFS family permease
VLDPDGVLAAVLGAALALWLTRARAALGLLAGAVAIVALAIVAAAGLPIQDRYVFLIAAIGAVFGGAALFGWRALPPEHPRRRLWQAGAVLVAIVIAGISVAWQAPRFGKTFTSTKPADQSLQAQQHIANDLKTLVSEHILTRKCLPISVPYATPIPLLALELHVSPARIVVGSVTHGTYLAATTQAVYRQYQLDRNDPQRDVGVPSNFVLLAGNSSWDVYSSCH